jgi:hypothetical protein
MERTVNLRFLGNFLEHELEVTGDYQPSEAMVMYYSDGSGYPGYGPSFEIDSVKLEGVDITDFLSSNKLAHIEEKCIEILEDEE